MHERQDEPTLIDRPLSAAPPRPEPTPSATQDSSLVSTVAIRDEQAARGRAIVWIGLAGALLMGSAIQIPERRPPGHWPATVGLFALALASAAILVASRRNRGVDARSVFALGLLATITILVVVYYTGPFSPAPLALFLGVYYFGLGDSRWHAWAVFGLCALGFAALGTLATLDLIAIDSTLIPTSTDRAVRGIATFVVSSFLGLTFWLARLSRSATLRAMTRLESAQRQIRQREALLHEARADLNQVLDAGRVGRYSGRAVGPYVLDQIVGRGAMAEVYSAVHIESGVEVAVKLLHPYILDEPTHVERFFREAEAAGSLDSIHIVKVHGSGIADDGSPYIAMERLIGLDLASHLRKRKLLRTTDVLDLVTQVAQALAAAQDAGIVHRDLKPQNLFLHERADGRVWKVLDFGVSKIDSLASNLTEGAAVGTPSYMSPEAARGLDVDHRADVFALGVIAYRCLTGRPAFTSSDPMTTMYNVVHAQPARPRDHVDLPEHVELALALAISKDRERRYPSATTFAAALRDAARGQLDERLERDARKLLAEQPWGSEISPR